MADKELKLKIGADAGQLSSELSGVINELKSFSLNVTKSFNTLSKSLDNFRKSTEGVSTSLSNIPQSFDTSAITQGVNTATNALEQIKETGNSVAQSLQSIPKSFAQIGANTSSLDKINTTIENTGNEALDTSRKFDVLSAIIANAIREIAASGAGINLVTAAINEMAAAGLKAGDGFLAIGVKQPIQDITALRANVAQLKQDLATGFKPIINVVDPKIPALLNSVSAALTNISPVVQSASNALQSASASTQLFADKALLSSKSFQAFASNVTAAISQIGASGAGINQITAAINEMAAAGIRAGKGFVIAIGVQKPIQDIDILRANVAQLKQDLASGFKPIVNVVDPKIPALLNSVSAALTNISPVVQNATAALQNASKSTQLFADKALLSSNTFQDFASNVATAISRIGASAAGVTEVTNAINQAAAAARSAGEGFLAIGVKAPIQDITTLRNNVQQLKEDLTRGFKPIINIIDPNIPALLNSVSASLTNISPAVQNASTALRNASASTEVFADKALLSSRAFQDFSVKVTSAISQIGASASGITQVTAAINEAAAASRAAGDGFLSIGVQKPIQDITLLRNNVEELRKDLERGFKPIVNLVDPNIGPLLNSVSAALTNISPAVNNANAALKLISASSQSFANSSLSSTRNFADFAVTVASASSSIASTGANILQITDAINQLGVATQNAGKGFLAIGVQAPIQDITILRNNVEQLKAELATGFKPIVGIVDPSTGPLLNSVSAAIANITPAINQASTAFKQAGGAAQVFSNATNTAVNQSVQSLQNFRKVATTVLNIPPPNIPPINLTARLPLAPLQNFNKELLVIRNTINSGFKPALDKISFSAANFSSIKNAGSAIKQLSPAAQSANFALTDMGRVLQDLPFGFAAIQNNITQLPASLGALSAAAKASGQSIGKVLLTSLTGAGGIGIALSAITAAVTFASVGFGSWNRILGDTGKKAEEAADKAKQFADELRSIGDIRIDAVGSVQGQIAEVQALSNAVRDETRSQEERGRALERLKAINKDHFGQLNLTREGLDRLTKSTNIYTQALIANALVEGFADELKKIGPELSKQENILIKVADAFRGVAGAQEAFAKAAIPDARNFAGTAQAVSQLQKLGVEQEKFTSQVNLVGSLRKQYVEVSKAMQGAVDAAIKLPPLTGASSDTKNLKDKDLVLKNLKTTLEQYNKQLDIANEKRKLGILPTFEENDVFVLETQILDILRKIDVREVELKLKPKLEIDPILDDASFKNLENTFRKNLAIENIVLPVDITPSINRQTYFSKLTEAFKSVENLHRRAISAITGIQIPIDLTIDTTGTSNVTKAFEKFIPEGYAMGSAIGTAIVKGIADGIAQKKEEAADSAKKTMEAINQQFEDDSLRILKNSITNIGTTIGDTLGEALAGGTSFDGINALLATLGEALREMGKAMIAAGVAKLAIDKALTAFGGAGMIAAGVLSVAIGAAIKASINKIPKFATGGIVTGPTVGLIGEAGPEVIFPLDRLSDFINTDGGVQDVRVYGEIHNDVIVISNKRGLASQGRRFGV